MEGEPGDREASWQTAAKYRASQSGAACGSPTVGGHIKKARKHRPSTQRNVIQPHTGMNMGTAAAWMLLENMLLSEAPVTEDHRE